MSKSTDREITWACDGLNDDTCWLLGYASEAKLNNGARASDFDRSCSTPVLPTGEKAS